MTEHSDTPPTVQAQYDALVMQLSPAERFQRALELSSFVRNLAWAGAERVAGHLGRDAVVTRFFLQVYGPAVQPPTSQARDD